MANRIRLLVAAIITTTALLGTAAPVPAHSLGGCYRLGIRLYNADNWNIDNQIEHLCATHDSRIDVCAIGACYQVEAIAFTTSATNDCYDIRLKEYTQGYEFGRLVLGENRDVHYDVPTMWDNELWLIRVYPC
jgi:hypothetical protein